MGIGMGSAALVTGAGSGIGRATSLALARRGTTVTVVDFSESDGQETVRLIENEWDKFEEARPEKPVAIFVKCDVAVPEQLAEAFMVHKRTYGRLDMTMNNAAIGDDTLFWDDDSQDPSSKWRKVIAVNLVAPIDGTRLAIQMMQEFHQSGVILNMASIAGFFPSYAAPLYSTTKAGVVMLTQSLESLKSEGIRVNALCPEHVYTNMTKDLPSKRIQHEFLPMEAVLKGVFELVDDESKAGACLVVANTLEHGCMYWPPSAEDTREAGREVETQERSWGAIFSDTISAAASYVQYILQKSSSFQGGHFYDAHFAALTRRKKVDVPKKIDAPKKVEMPKIVRLLSI